MEDHTNRTSSLRLFVRCTFIAPGTVLLVLNPPGLFLLVFRCAVITTLAGRAFQSDDVSHDVLLRLWTNWFRL